MKAKMWMVTGLCGALCVAGAVGAGKMVRNHTMAQRAAFLAGDVYLPGDGLLPDARRQEIREYLDELGTMLGARIRERMDADGDGQIGDSEREGARLKAKETAARLKLAALGRFDADFDGTLSAEEREAARDAARTRLKGAMDGADADQDGRVSDSEVRSAALSKEGVARWNTRMGEAGVTPLLSEEEQVRARVLLGEVLISVRAGILEEFDADGDGALSEGERESLRAQARVRGEEIRTEAVKRGDQDGDGVLSRQERRGLVRETVMDFLGLRN